MDDTQEELDPQMVEAAIRAGEQAAQEDFARDAERARSERDELAASLAKAEEEAEKARTEGRMLPLAWLACRPIGTTTASARPKSVWPSASVRQRSW